MKFMMTYQISTQDYENARNRFRETGALPPDGVTLVNRWHAAAGRHGYMLIETDDPAAAYRYASQWHDVCSFTIVPVVNDEEARDVLMSL